MLHIEPLSSNRGCIQALLFTSDITMLSGSHDGTVKHWDLALGRVTHHVAMGLQEIKFLAYEPTRQLVAIANYSGPPFNAPNFLGPKSQNRMITCRNLHSGQEAFSIMNASGPLVFSSRVPSLFHTTDNEDIRSWNYETESENWHKKFSDRWITEIRYDEINDWLVLIIDDRLHVLDASTGKENVEVMQRFSNDKALGVSANGRFAIIVDTKHEWGDDESQANIALRAVRISN